MMHTRAEICVQIACIALAKILVASSVSLAIVGACMFLLPAAIAPTYIAVLAGGSTLFVCKATADALFFQ